MPKTYAHHFTIHLKHPYPSSEPLNEFFVTLNKPFFYKAHYKFAIPKTGSSNSLILAKRKYKSCVYKSSWGTVVAPVEQVASVLLFVGWLDKKVLLCLENPVIDCSSYQSIYDDETEKTAIEDEGIIDPQGRPKR